MIQRRKLTTVFLTLMMLAVAAVAPLSAAPPSNGSLTTGIVQTIPGVGTFVGALTANSVHFANGVLSAVGALTGTFTPLTGASAGIPQTINQAISIPLTSVTGTCTILTLHTAAITLNVLGLNVALAPIDLVITAEAAPGNLLGNLLC